MDLNQSIEFNRSAVMDHALPTDFFMLPNYHHNQTTKEIQKQSLQLFWNQRLSEIHKATAIKSNHLLPLARIKRVMKSDGDVKMISADTPILFSKACELFILELTLRSWLQTADGKRRTLQVCDIARAIREDDMLNFLIPVVPYDHDKEDEGSKCIEDNMHTLSNLQMPFPFLDLNGELMMDQNHQLTHQQLMIKPSMPSSDFPSNLLQSMQIDRGNQGCGGK